mgnify:CR=1 FL=1
MCCLIGFELRKTRLRRAGTHVLRVVKHRRPRIIVSMTSYPARINTVHLAIRSLLAQKVLPDKIVLWLCKSDFPNRETDLPQTLRDVLWHDVEIRWVDEDLKPHKKYFWALQEFPDDYVITTDDGFAVPQYDDWPICSQHTKPILMRLPLYVRI